MLDEKFNYIELNKVLNDKTVIANSRHEMDLTNGTYFLDKIFARGFHAHTQDAWFCRTPINIKTGVDVDFELGLVGCDNAIAHRFQISGYTVYNMPERFRVIHVDNIRGKNSQNFTQFHNDYEKTKKIVNKHPENEGQLLVPNYDAVKNISIDNLITSLNYSEQKRVLLITHILSETIKINNK
jgi:hypothetical protein